jgi:hypothetical protein
VLLLPAWPVRGIARLRHGGTLGPPSEEEPLGVEADDDVKGSIFCEI